MTPIAASDWDAVISLVRNARSLLLLGHVSPDGDALGSALAVGLAIRSMPGDRKIQVSFGDDPFVVPANLRHLPGQELLVRPADVTPPDVVMSFDASSADRLGLLQELSESAPTLVVVDHHSSYDGFGTLAVVDIRRASYCRDRRRTDRASGRRTHSGHRDVPLLGTWSQTPGRSATRERQQKLTH